MELDAILRKGDCYGQSGYPLFPPVYDMLVEFIDQDLTPACGKTFNIRLMVPGTSSLLDFKNQILPTERDKCISDRIYTIKWNHPTCTPMTGKMWLFHVEEQYPTETADWTFTPSSRILPTYEAIHGSVGFNEQNPIKLLELFCGGCGGWGGAMCFLKQFLQFPAQIVGIDSSWEAIQQYAVTYSTNVLNGFQDFPSSLLDQEHTAIWGDIDDDDFCGFPRWIEQVMAWSPDFVTISSPCPPWSNAGRNTGITVQEGCLFPKLCQFVSWQSHDSSVSSK